MLVAVLTIRIDDPDIFHHAVKVDDTIGRARKYRCHPCGEYFPRDRFSLQTLPSPAVKHTNVGNVERDALALKGLNKLGPDNISKSISQDLGLSPLCSAIEKFLQIETCI